MDKYTREVEARPEDIKSKPTDNEIRVTTLGKMRSYITYATKKLQDGKCDEITLKAMGKAINKTVTIAEIIKRRIPKLHQITQINSTLIQEKYVPREDGLDPVFTTRHVSSILISLLTREPDTSTVGYQPPIPEEDVKSTPVRTNTFPNPSRPANNTGRGRNMRGRRGRGRRPLKPFSNNSKGDTNPDTRAQDTQSQQNPASPQQYPQSTQTQNQPYQQQNQPYQQQNQPYQQNQSYQQQNQSYGQQNQSYGQQNQPYQQQYSGQRSNRGGRGRRGGRGGIGGGRGRRGGRNRGGPRNTTGDTRQN
jgi:DNA-binding protein Alba